MMLGMKNFDVCPKMQINGDELDFVADPQNSEQNYENDRKQS